MDRRVLFALLRVIGTVISGTATVLSLNNVSKNKKERR